MAIAAIFSSHKGAKDTKIYAFKIIEAVALRGIAIISLAETLQQMNAPVAALKNAQTGIPTCISEESKDD